VSRPALPLLAGLCLWASACEPRGGATRPPGATSGRRLTATTTASRPTDVLAAYVKTHYDKREYRIPMRDGVHLFTAVFTPKQAEGPLPFLLKRTPYGVGPYGEDVFPETLGPSPELLQDGYIFVLQDVRGRYMSEGEFTDMRPHLADKQGPEQTDESTDTWDTIAWLLEHVEGHNGKVGQWGVSYPGFYAVAGMISAHPALIAVSPQAPIADWWFDDFRHHGAFFLPHCFNFMANFGRRRPAPTPDKVEPFVHGTPDGFAFFQRLGALSHVDERWFRAEIEFWNQLVAHPDYDAFWQARNILPHLRDVAPAVMTVGGWFDAEDLYGPLQIYRAIEAQDPDAFNVLVMGPWSHGGWERSDGDHLGNVAFGSKTAVFYRQQIERRFFDHFLKDGPAHELPEAYVFETGANRWRTFEAWPPAQTRPRQLWLHEDGQLRFDAAPTASRAFDEWVSDPAHPVPYTEDVAIGMTKEYMIDDQRFASRRADVMVYATEPMTEPMTLAGPIVADLWVSTSGADADFVVKLVDVFPADAADHRFVEPGQHMGEYQMLVRSEVIRGRYRESHEKPVPFRPGRPTRVELPLQDVLHTFQPGHRIMVQVQSTWFPLVDLNPQTWVPNLFLATDDQFAPATHRLWRDRTHPTHLRVGVL
jgi:hypothetical protein